MVVHFRWNMVKICKFPVVNNQNLHPGFLAAFGPKMCTKTMPKPFQFCWKFFGVMASEGTYWNPKSIKCWWAHYLANCGFSHFLALSRMRKNDHVSMWHAMDNTWPFPTHSDAIWSFPSDISIMQSIVRFNHTGSPSCHLIVAKTWDHEALIKFIQ